jgi:hypothetical protein
MTVTDQINALRALGTDPVRKLVVPRVLAGFFMAPVLTIMYDTVAIYGGRRGCLCSRHRRRFFPLASVDYAAVLMRWLPGSFDQFARD